MNDPYLQLTYLTIVSHLQLYWAEGWSLIILYLRCEVWREDVRLFVRVGGNMSSMKIMLVSLESQK